MNPMSKFQQLGQFMKGIKNPQEMIFNMLGNNTNPMAQKVLEMAKNGDRKGIERFARNVCQEKGVDFDKEFENFSKNFR